MPKAIKKRTKKTAETQDVSERLFDIKEKMRERQKTLATYGIAGLVVIIAIAGIFAFSYSARQKAKAKEYEGYKIFYNEYTKAPLPESERYQKALDLFQQAYSTRKSPRVLLYIANAQYELGRFDEALVTLGDFTKRYSSAQDLLPLAYVKTAQVQIRKGNKEEALKALGTISQLRGNLYKDTALYESAKILESDGKKQEAAAKYKELAEKYKDSPYAEEAKAKGEAK